MALLEVKIDSKIKVVNLVILTESVKLIEAYGTHAFILCDAASMEDMLAFKQPYLLLVIEPGVEPLFAEAATKLLLRDALCQVVQFNVGVRTYVLL